MALAMLPRLQGQLLLSACAGCLPTDAEWAIGSLSKFTQRSIDYTYIIVPYHCEIANFFRGSFGI
jgi:hypothetical protein